MHPSVENSSPTRHPLTPLLSLRFWKLLFKTVQMKVDRYFNGGGSSADYISRFYTRELNDDVRVRSLGDKFAPVRTMMVELAEPQLGETVLDAGTGLGWQAAAFARQGLTCTGIDFVPDRVKYAQEIHGSGIIWKTGDIANLPLKTNGYDIVSASLVLHDLSLERELAALSELRRVARRRVVIVEPQAPKHPVMRWLYATIGGIFDESLYFSSFVNRDFEAHLAQTGLKLISKHRAYYGVVTIFVCDV